MLKDTEDSKKSLEEELQKTAQVRVHTRYLLWVMHQTPGDP
jgi:hypothetical protein